MLTFPEAKFTCLGYGGETIGGSGNGKAIRETILATAKEVVELGIDDPDLFAAMAVFEKDVGPDRIGDMTATVILKDLISFNERILRELGLTGQIHTFRLDAVPIVSSNLLINPFAKGRVPVLLVPQDILNDLPVAQSWDDVETATDKNEALRRRVNEHLGDIWTAKVRRDKRDMRARALVSKQAFGTLLEALKSARANAYDATNDPQGLLIWRQVIREIATIEPLHLMAPEAMDLDSVGAIVRRIIEQFKFLIEDRGLAKELYAGGERRPESSAQHLLYAVAHSYCEANNLDITPEAHTGRGPVDFKISSGFTGRVLVEVKLSTNPNIEHGYEKQLEIYKTGEQTARAFYVVIDVDEKLSAKSRPLFDLQRKTREAGRSASEIVLIDGSLRPSASKATA